MVKRLWQSYGAGERGAELVEQALLLLLVAVVGLAVLAATVSALGDRFKELLQGFGLS